MSKEFFTPSLDLAADIDAYLPIPQPIVGGHFIEKNLNLVVGQPGSYKTIVMLEIASAIAIGRPAFGIIPVKQGRVVFITGDDPREIVVERIRMLNSSMLDGVRFMDPRIKKMLGANLDIRVIEQVLTTKVPEIAKFFMSTIDGAQLAVFDPLRHFIGQVDENKAHEIYDQLEPIRWMANTSPCAIAMVHHSKKEGGSDAASRLNNFRGSGAIRGLSRALVNIERLNHGEQPPKISITGENRFSEEPEALVFEIHKHGSTFQFIRPSLMNQIVATLAASEHRKGLTTNEIVTILGEPANSVRSALQRLREKKVVDVAEGGGRGKTALWVSTGYIDTSLF